MFNFFFNEHKTSRGAATSKTSFLNSFENLFKIHGVGYKNTDYYTRGLVKEGCQSIDLAFTIADVFEYT